MPEVVQHIANSAFLLNQLAEAGLPLPPEASEVTIQIDCGSVPSITVKSYFTHDDARVIAEVLKKYLIVEVKDEKELDVPALPRDGGAVAAEER